MASSTFIWDFTNGVRCDSNGILVSKTPDIFYQQHPSWQVSFKTNAVGTLSALDVSGATAWAAAIDTAYSNSGDPCCRTLNADIDSSGAASGNIVVSLDANTSSFLTAIATAIDGRVAGYFELRGLDGSGEMIYYAYFPVYLRNTLDPSGGTPPDPVGDYYNKAETDALVGAKLSDAASDGKQYCRKDGAWSEISVTGIGDVVGPASSTDGNIVLFNGSSGKTIKNSSYSPSSFSLAGHNHASVYEPANANIQNHISSSSNPHSVTKTQIGLANVTNDAQLKIASNLSDLANAATARTNLGLGGAATLSVGTGSGTVAAGDDARFGNATTLQSRAFASTAPTDGQAIVWDNGNSTWKPGTVSGGSMVYPGAGVANSTGSAWGTSLTVGTSANNLVQLDGSAKLPAVDGSALTGLSAANMTSLDFVGGRLTLATATPVMTADSTSSTTLYYTPYRNNLITLYTGSAWKTMSFSELSLSLSGLSGVYDIWAYDNSGTVALEALAWTNTTTRATALAYQDGRLVKSGTATRRYLGSINVTSDTCYAVLKSEASGGTANCKLDIWNYYNRVPVRLLRRDTTANWTYNTASYRQANNSAGNQCNFLIGVSEDAVTSSIHAVTAMDNAAYTAYNATALDSTSTASARARTPGAVAQGNIGTCTVYPGIGTHYFAWIEAPSAGTITNYGSGADGLVVNMQY